MQIAKVAVKGWIAGLATEVVEIHGREKLDGDFSKHIVLFRRHPSCVS